MKLFRVIKMIKFVVTDFQKIIVGYEELSCSFAEGKGGAEGKLRDKKFFFKKILKHDENYMPEIEESLGKT